MESRIKAIFSTYCNTVKPLLADIQYRKGGDKLPDNFLNEIRALNDHIARCYRERISDHEIDAELTKAEGHLRRLIYDCFKQLNIYIFYTLYRKEQRFYSDLWLTHDNGKFWKEYSKSRKYAQKNVITAKKNESAEPDKAMQFYEKAFQEYRRAEDLLLTNKGLMWRSRLYKYWTKAGHFSSWFLITFVISLLAALIGIFL